MLSKNKIKYLSSLSEKKGRMENQVFLVEGEKMVFEVLASRFQVNSLLFTERMSRIIPQTISDKIEKFEINESESSKISSLKTPQGIFAEIKIPEDFYSEKFIPKGDLIMALNDIQDPGNLGTIVRTADWFGVKQIICSKATADILNPKVLQSTMGAIFRVKLTYTDLIETIHELRHNDKSMPIFAAVLEGLDIYNTDLPKNGVLMMGNESKGLSKELINLATHKITIPRFGNLETSSESLNVSIATAVILSELRRKAI